MGARMLRKGLAVAVILLFIGVAFAPSINAIEDPIPDLDCDGELDWIDVVPGATVTGTITVENIGEPDSLLDWEIVSWPDWGTWCFDPEYGTDLLAGDMMTVNVEVVFPDPPEEEQWSEIIIVNIDNPDDYCVIDVYYRGKPVNADATPIEFELQRIKELVQSIDLRKIIVNPDAVVETLEEISSILEEEDVRNYIEKSSEEDCGCDDDSLNLGGVFPILCILLFPLYIISWYIFWFGVSEIPIQMVMPLGYRLGCDWV